MKRKSDPRHLARRDLIEKLFAWSFDESQSHGNMRFHNILPHVNAINEIIQKTAPQWPLDQINRLDLSVLRLAIYELFFEPETPSKVVIDEAVELGKEYGTDSSGPFINGVLGNVMNHFENYRKEVGGLEG